MTETAYLVLQDGSSYKGESFGSNVTSVGEIVFNTSMTGYQEILTDPSYSGQIVMPTYPIIGNYGVNGKDIESNNVQVAGFVVRDHCLQPSHNLSNMTLSEYLSSQGIAGISGIDTRSVTRKIRLSGVMMGAIAIGISPDEAISVLQKYPNYDTRNFVETVSTNTPYYWEMDANEVDTRDKQLILVSDYGLKYNILRILKYKGFRVMAMPAYATPEDILSLNPKGIVLSPGPGDPSLLSDLIHTTRTLAEKVPIMGICLGHQIIARAFGAQTFKLKFGHRGGNHPVRNIEDKRVYITAQNHGYAVSADKLPSKLRISHINLNDGTIEGLEHTELPIMSIQYHSEASPGPLDNLYLFDKFIRMVNSN